MMTAMDWFGSELEIGEEVGSLSCQTFLCERFVEALMFAF